MFENRLNCDTSLEHVRAENVSDPFSDIFGEMDFDEAIREAERRNAEEN